MENPQDNTASKRFRWVGQPSEAELLGLPGPTRRHTGVSFLPRQAPAPMPVPASPNAAPRRRRVRVRDGATVAAVGVAIWFAVQGAGTGLPFRGGSAAAPEAVDFVGAGISLDRHELSALPRHADRSGSAAQPGGQTAGERRSGSKPKTDSNSSSPGETTTDDPAQPPLVQATIPGVGSVTVEQPDLSPLGGTPTLPDTGDVLPETPTLPPLP